MERISARSMEIWHALAESFTATNLQLCLLIGSGVLAISLLVLALTRWGQSRPVWKCVILSFGAHILLIGYAYGTHLIFESPPVAEKADPLRVNLVEEIGKSLDGADPLDSVTQPWDEFVNQQALPEVESLERPLIDSQVVIERITDREIEQPTKNDSDLPVELQQEFQPPTETKIEASDIAAIEVEDVQIAAPEIEVTRRGDNQDPAVEAPQYDWPLEIARTEIENDFTPIDKPGDSADQLHENQFDSSVFVGELVDRDAELPLDENLLPSPSTAPPPVDFKPLKPQRAANRMKLISSPRRLGDGQPLPRVYSLRSVENRFEVAKRRGGSIETEQAVNAALRWLSENQEENGHWDASQTGAGKETNVFGHDRKGAGADADCGITGLATLSFLAAGHTHLEGPYQDEIQHALEFLVRQQKVDGNLAGDARLFAKMYCHSMSLLALSEALAITGDQRLLPVVQRGVSYSVRAQSRQDGSWRYQPGDDGDMSQFGWQVLALHSARLGGAVVPQSTFDRMEKFLDKCTSGVGGGLASYRPGQGPSTTMTAEALLCRYFLQKSVPQQTLMEASRRIAQERPTPHHVNLYYWYYGTLAMYHAGGSDWERWNSELKKTLLGLQQQKGGDAGSWEPNGVWGGYGGRVYSTAMATLNLEVYYRYLPMYDVAGQKDGQPLFR